MQEDRELTNATINKLRGTFSMMFKHDKRKDLVDVNPAGEVPLRDVGEGIERFLSAEKKSGYAPCFTRTSIPRNRSSVRSSGSKLSIGSCSRSVP